ncbi:MAG: ABC transporter ATP-binding protein [Eubacteriales bacterium]|nr:ABC transporter ATP-binding protein [Eubacteriales bacterium]
MARIQLEGVTRRYGRTTAINHLSLDVKDNEFFVLFGPAGAGKTTTLKCIAGSEFPQEGLVKIDGRIVNLVEPSDRNVSMVFENYALYPHLSVYDNIAFPLRSKLYRRSEAEIREAIDRIARLMRIDMLYDRKPAQLSNGQRQRVAIGRCLVRTPNVFLMDEPLAHLDAKLKHTMRSELKEMQSAFNTTTIYVTHDYMEAMSLADRIAVLDKGEVRQLGTAREMYYTPGSEFVARLFGEPEINLLPAQFSVSDGEGWIALPDGVRYKLPEDVTAALKGAPSASLDIGLRGNDIEFSFERRDGWIPGTVYASEPIGNKVILTVAAAGAQLRLVAPNDTQARLDSTVYVRPNYERALYFDRASEAFITRHDVEGILAYHRGDREKGGEGSWQC